MDEVTVTLPPTSPTTITEDEVFPILLAAYKQSVDYLVNMPVTRQRLRTVYRVKENGHEATSVVLPDFDFTRNVIGEIAILSAVQNAIDYFWDHGRPAYTVTGPNPTRDSWGLGDGS